MTTYWRLGVVPGLVLALFVALKLTGKVAWSWWLVTSPAWAPLALVLGAGFVFAAVALVIVITEVMFS